jgi:hypothetical protein
MISQPIVASIILSNMLYVDECCHAVGWLPLTVYLVISSDHCMCSTVERSTVVLCTNCFTMRKKINQNPKIHLLWSCQLIAVPWILLVVEIACDAIPCWIAFTLEWSSVPTSHHRSPFTPFQTGADVWQTQQCAAPSSRTFTSLGPTGHALPWIIVPTHQALCHRWMKHLAL